MREQITFFDFFESFVPPRELRLLFHDAVVTGGALDVKQRALELDVATGERIPEAAQTALEQLLTRQYGLHRLHLTIHDRKAEKKSGGTEVLLGKEIKGKPVSMTELNVKMGTAIVEGKVFAAECRETKRPGMWMLSFDMTDYQSSVTVRKYTEGQEALALQNAITPGMWLRVQGQPELTRDGKDIQLKPYHIMKVPHEGRKDTAPEKRVELHLHTKMSNMDALTDTASVIKQAISWGHPAIAITDHGVAQSFPDAWHTAKGKIKILYGVEGYYVNNLDDRIAVHGPQDQNFADEIVCFDIETTGLKVEREAITEIGAVVLRNGEVAERFQTFVNPNRRLTPEIVGLTGITDAMLADAPQLKEALTSFLEFVGDRPLAAHNAEFDISFIRAGCRKVGLPFDPTYVDSLILAQNLLPELHKYKLDIVAEHLDLPAFNHHRASDDAAMVAYMLIPFFEKMERELGIHRLQEINGEMLKLRPQGSKTSRFPKHIIILAKNKLGLKHLYQLISASNLKYFKRVPIIPKTELITHSACEAGELFRAVTDHKDWAELKRIASFYDYLEIQPICNNLFMLRNGDVQSEEELREYNRTIVRLGEELHKPVCATGDVHFLDKEDEIYRQILQFGMKFGDAMRETSLYLKTTDEMLEEFSYLGADKAFEVVVTNTRAIADRIDGGIKPIPDGQYTPKIEGAEEELTTCCYDRAREMYGDPLPKLVAERTEKELSSIIKNGFAVLYIIARKLVMNSESQGYLVGSRGSVGSSVIATLCGVSEVNPLPPHYRCPKCRHSEFFTNGEVGSGFDLPPKNCPACGTPMLMDGHDIPFETFLGFHGEKAPDIDLNFSGDNQADAHKYTEVLFGKENIFRAGTVGTIASKTAYGFVKKFLEEKGLTLTKAEENRLISGCVGIKRTTGQHPGGIVVIPKEYQIYDFTPIQHPADKDSSGVITTHFAFEYLHDTLLKLDILGHDVPTFYKVFEDYTGIDIRTVPMNDPEVMELFNSTKPLKPREDTGCELGAHALPEITPYVMQMMQTAKPKTFADLLQISGLSHGTGIWLGNGEELIKNGTCTIKEIIGTRDSIMLYLIQKGVDYSMAFKIMESVRKGKGLTEEMETAMRGSAVPEWYIESCKKIRYMFPKSHAAAYMMGTLRLGWCKVHRPVEYYATYFTVKPEGFDASIAAGGMKAVRKKIVELENSEETNKKDADTLVCLQVIREMFARGYEFLPVDVYKSHAYRFVPENGKIRMPFSALVGLGETAAQNIYDAIRNGRATTLEELKTVASLTKNVVEILRSNDCLGGLPESDQMTLF